jgi:hypothetical protein
MQNRKGETMHPPSRFGPKTAALVAALLLVGTAAAQEARPAGPAPHVQKMTIYNGSVPLVSYSVEGGSPHLLALSQALQFTENELTLTGELQKLRLGIVANEQTLDTLRISQALGLGLGPISTRGYAACSVLPDSALKRALLPGLAREATPAAAFELIQLRERLQTELQAEQGKAVATLQGEPPTRQKAQPIAPVAGPVAGPQSKTTVPGAVAAAQAVPQQLPTPGPFALPQTVGPNQDTLRQQVLRLQQQILQSQQQILHWHQPPIIPVQG